MWIHVIQVLPFFLGLMQLHSSKLNHYIKMAVFLHIVLGKPWKRQNAKGVAFLNHRIKTFSTGFPGCSVGKESTCNVGDMCSIPGSGRSLGVGNGNPLQDYCLESSWTEEPGRPQSMGSQRVGCNRVHRHKVTQPWPRVFKGKEEAWVSHYKS